MKTALVFPGQGAQKPGMGQALYQASEVAQKMFHEANDILGFDIMDIMFNGTEDDLKQTSVTQPAVYIHSVALAMAGQFQGDMAAGHSLGEFSALAAAGVLSFADGLRLVQIRANAMQKACDAAPSTMAAIIGLDDDVVSDLCSGIDDVVVPANFNTIGQLVISGSMSGVQAAMEAATAAGAMKVVQLNVNGAFHSPFMQPAAEELEAGIRNTSFQPARIPVYQNVTAAPETDPVAIQENLVAQLTGAVRWTQTMQNMIADGATSFVELGPGNVLRGLLRRVDRKMPAKGYESLPEDGE